MPAERTIFLDFDDTLSDPFQFHVQNAHAIGAVLAEQYGGDRDGWAKAAVDLLKEFEKEYEDKFVDTPLNGYCEWLTTVRERSALQMFERMGLPSPLEPTRVARETQFRALLRCNAAFPNAGTVLHAIRKAGYRINMASAQESEYLDAALRGAGLSDHFEWKFGPDLVNCAKEGPEYYRRIFAAAGVAAADCVVVDDFPRAIDWAMSAGASVIQAKVSCERHYDVVPGVAGVIYELADLPGMVDAIFAMR